jgi:hypothetical protein
MHSLHNITSQSKLLQILIMASFPSLPKQDNSYTTVVRSPEHPLRKRRAIREGEVGIKARATASYA